MMWEIFKIDAIEIDRLQPMKVIILHCKTILITCNYGLYKMRCMFAYQLPLKLCIKIARLCGMFNWKAKRISNGQNNESKLGYYFVRKKSYRTMVLTIFFLGL